MKKLLCLLVVGFFALNVNVNSADAKIPNKFDYLILDLFNEQIGDAVTSYYKDDSVRVQYNWSKNLNVIEVDQSEKGHELEASYVVKIHIKTVKNNRGILGIDTITFGVSPSITEEKNVGTEIRLLSYEHNDPSKGK